MAITHVKCFIKGSSAANYPAAWRPSVPGKQSGHVPVTETTFIQLRDYVLGSSEIPTEISIGLPLSLKVKTRSV